MPNPMSPEIMQAMKRRDGGQTPPPDAPISQPVQPMPQGEMTQASGPAGAATPQAPKMPKFEPQDRQDLITVALIEQLKNDGKLVKEQGKAPVGAPQTPPAPQQPAPAPQGQAMGGGSFSMSSGFEQPMPVNQMQSNYGNGMGKDYSGLSGYGR